MKDRLYLLKIEMFGIEPEIWRRFVVPASITLDQLHNVIQIVMGWEDSHLYEFTVGENRYAQDPGFGEGWLECCKYRLGDLVKKKGQKITYMYDFGESWMHGLVVEDSRYENAELKLDIACLGGERACPPDDIGGIDGYYDLCEAMEDPTHEEHDSLVEWLGQEYDPEKFDIEAVNSELKSLQN